MSKHLAYRLDRIERDLDDAGDRCPDCPKFVTLLGHEAGEPSPEIPCCPSCGRPVEAVIITEEIVTAGSPSGENEAP